MQLQNIERDLKRAQDKSLRQTLQEQNEYRQTRYRWVVLLLATTMMFLNGLLNNIIIPLQNKLTNIYQVSNKVVNLANILSFVVFLAVNLPANQILDQRGIKFGFVLGSSLYLLGIFLCCFINVGFPFVIIGYLFFVGGQPFITNIPAKIATYWFFPKNRALATSILVGASIIGSGVGFAVPSFVVKEESEGDEAKRQIFSLYLGYTIISFIMLAANSILMKSRPYILPSKINVKQRLSLKQIFQKIKADRNLWKFFASYSLFYGTFIIFAMSGNFLIKPFGFSDLAISLSAVALILLGAVGAIISSLFIKRTKNYSLLIRILTFSASGGLILMLLQMYILPKAAITVIIVGLIGFFVVPMVPTTYQIGCELAFPMGQAQVTGILNGGASIWGFVMDSILTAAIGFGSKAKSSIIVIILIAFLILGSLLYSKTKIILRRKQFEQGVSSSSPESQSPEQSNEPAQKMEIEMVITPIVIEVQNTTELDKQKKENYQNLNQQKTV